MGKSGLLSKCIEQNSYRPNFEENPIWNATGNADLQKPWKYDAATLACQNWFLHLWPNALIISSQPLTWRESKFCCKIIGWIFGGLLCTLVAAITFLLSTVSLEISPRALHLSILDGSGTIVFGNLITNNFSITTASSTCYEYEIQRFPLVTCFSFQVARQSKLQGLLW